MIKKCTTLAILYIFCYANTAHASSMLFAKKSNYYDHNSDREYFMIFSDAENHWQNIIPVAGLPKKTAVRYYHIQCTMNQCIALGSYSQPWNPTVPLMLSSEDSGKSWSQVSHINGISTKVSYLKGAFTHAICHGKHCFATGSAEDVAADDQSYSLITSDDGGATWSVSPEQDNTGGVASRLDMYCIKDNCVSRKNIHGDFLISSHRGIDWKPVTFTMPNARKTEIHRMSNVDNHFVAVGNYNDASWKTYSLILTSTDGGESWQTTLDSKDVPGSFHTSFRHLSCQGTVCLAAAAFGKHPLLMLSRDAGLSWQWLNPKDQMPESTLSCSVQHSVCTDKACTIIGTFHLPDSNLPLIARVDLEDTDNTYHFLSGSVSPDTETQDIRCDDSTCHIAGNHPGNPGQNTRSAILLESDTSMAFWKDISDINYPLRRGDHISIEMLALSK